MIERFTGIGGRERLFTALMAQKLVEGDASLAESLCDASELVEVPKGSVIIQEDAGDNDVFFVLAGRVDVLVKTRQIASRGPGDSIGEMAAIDPAQPRSATVVATETTVLAKVSETDLTRIATSYPNLWRRAARELSKRLFQRNALVAPSNEKPKLFVVSSAEALEIARELQNALERDALVTVWTDGVFFASTYPLEALEAAVGASDFAVAIAQPDDVVESRGTTQAAPRDNVVFELGLFMGCLGRTRTVLMQPAGAEIKLPSDLGGLTAISYRTAKDTDLPAAMAPACNQIRTLVKRLGCK